MSVWRLLHLAGLILWMGGAVAAFLLDAKADRESGAARAVVVRLAAQLQTWLIAPGAVITVMSGFMISFRYYQNGIDIMTPRLLVMQGIGILGAIFVLALVLPSTAQVVRAAAYEAETGQTGQRLNELRRRVAVASGLAWLMAVVALAAWVF